jgi:predicted RNase H-like HicB family nuclease
VNNANRYPVNVFWSDEDEGFIAVASDLPGCSAFGGTPHEALTELQSAIVAWIEAARAAGNPIPEPSKPAADNIYSGKIPQQLAQAAKTETVSLNQHIVFLLTWATAHRTLTTDWTVTVGQGQAVIAGSGLFSAPHRRKLFSVGAPQIAWAFANVAKVETSVKFIPHRALALGDRTA